MSLTIAQMKLAPNAKRGAIWVRDRHPSIVFTSGRRDAMDQARVMARNTLRYGKNWMLQTYKRQPNGAPSPIIQTLYNWIEAHPEALTVSVIAQGFYDCLLSCHSGDLTRLSRHLTGDAWDAQWPADDEVGEGICADIEKNMPVEYGLEKLLKREGALKLIHAQFAASVEV